MTAPTPDIRDLAATLTTRQLELRTGDLARAAGRLADDATRFAASIHSRPVAGDASRIAQAALQLAIEAARLDGMREIAGVFTTEGPS